MEALSSSEGSNAPIAPWDYRYWGEKVRKAKYDLDETEVKPYLQLHRMLEGMFWAAGELFGLVFLIPLLAQVLPNNWFHDIARWLPGGTSCGKAGTRRFAAGGRRERS